MIQRNPTTKTQERILQFLKEQEKLVSINHISSELSMDHYSVRASIIFFEKIGLIDILPTNNSRALIQIKKGSDNGTTIPN